MWRVWREAATGDVDTERHEPINTTLCRKGVLTPSTNRVFQSVAGAFSY